MTIEHGPQSEETAKTQRREGRRKEIRLVLSGFPLQSKKHGVEIANDCIYDTCNQLCHFSGI
jgi:hypothetical protein